jgi:hypothetical protein
VDALGIIKAAILFNSRNLSQANPIDSLYPVVLSISNSILAQVGCFCDRSDPKGSADQTHADVAELVYAHV